MAERDPVERDLFGAVPARVGPVPGVERTRAWRERQRAAIKALEARFRHLAAVTVARYMVHAVEDGRSDDAKALWLEFGRRQGWK